jgi:hypothetical protein
VSDDSNGELMTDEEYAAAIKEYDAKLALEEAVDPPPTAQQVFATMTKLGGGNHEANEDGQHAEAGARQGIKNTEDPARVIPPPPLIPPLQLRIRSLPLQTRCIAPYSQLPSLWIVSTK